MCGRYRNRREKQEIAKRFKAKKVFAEPLAPNYNIAPTTFQPIIRNDRETGEREMILARWGLIPFTAESLDAMKKYSTSNARADGLMTSNWYKRPFLKHRCIIPMDAFYEWEKRTVERYGKTGKRLTPGVEKIPYDFSLANGDMLAVAGLYDAWREPGGGWLQSYTVVTTEANELLSTIHDRMPVILYERDWQRWLDRGDSERPPVDLLRPYESELMEKRACNPAVNNAQNNGPEMLVCPTSDAPLWLLNSA